MRRPAHSRRPAAPGWTHPYTGPAALAVFHADGGDPETPPVPKPGPPPGPAREFTQEDLERIAAKEKSQGERAGARKALETFAADHGFTTAEDAAAFIAAARKAQQEALTEEERRLKELAEREQQLTAREAAATARERDANRRALLAGLGATGDDLDDAAALLRAPDDADDDTVREAAGKLKERRPELFARPAAAPTGEQTPAPGLPPAPGGAPAGRPPRAPASKDDIKARARARAEQMGYATPAA